MYLIHNPLIFLLACEILVSAAPVSISTPSPTTIDGPKANSSPTPILAEKNPLLAFNQQSGNLFANNNEIKASNPVRASEPLASPPAAADRDPLYNYPNIPDYYREAKDTAEEYGPAATGIDNRHRFVHEDYDFDGPREEERNFISPEDDSPSVTIPAPAHIAELFGRGVRPGDSQGDFEDQGHEVGEESSHLVTTLATIYGRQFDNIDDGVGWDGEKKQDDVFKEDVLSSLPTPTPTPDPSTYTSYGDYGNYGAYGDYGKYGSYRSH